MWRKQLLVFLILQSALSSSAQCWNKIDSGGGHNVALRLDGSLIGWGNNSNGQLGIINCASNQCLNQNLINNEIQYESIYCGGAHTILKKNDGTLWSFGANNHGQLGLGINNTNDINLPTQIGNLNNWNYASTINTHVLALKIDGTMWAWGYNLYGQLGDATNIDKVLPIQIGSESNWIKVRTGYTHSLAIKSNGTLWAWGRNNSGQLGDGTLIDKNLPLQIGNDNDWNNVYAGMEFSIGLKNDGTIWAWGNNTTGQLGDGSYINKNFPIQIGSNSNWESLDCDYGHTLAIKNDGTLWAWGWNNGYRLGDGTTTNRNLPIQIGNLNSWRKVSAGGGFSIALTNDNDLYGWGINNVGQLGNGNNQIVQTPTLLQCTLNNQTFQQSKITLYPNPTKSILNITTSVPIQKTILYSMLGKKVLEENYKESLDIGNLARGIYVIKLYNEDNEVYVDKVVKE